MLKFGITKAVSLHLGLTLPNLVDPGMHYAFFDGQQLTGNKECEA